MNTLMEKLNQGFYAVSNSSHALFIWTALAFTLIALLFNLGVVLFKEKAMIKKMAQSTKV